MKRMTTLRHQFIEYMPSDLEEGTIYVSMAFATVAHKCCCGCGTEVVTPLSPTDWKLVFDGESISLHPSIGNWSFDCKSHYWIRRGRVRWAPRWSQQAIADGRDRDQSAKQSSFGTADTAVDIAASDRADTLEGGKANPGVWRKLMGWWS